MKHQLLVSARVKSLKIQLEPEDLIRSKKVFYFFQVIRLYFNFADISIQDYLEDIGFLDNLSVLDNCHEKNNRKIAVKYICSNPF